MGFHRLWIFLLLACLFLPATGVAQQSGPLPDPEADPEAYKRMHPLDAIYYRKEMMEEYVKERERKRRMRQMESWDNQRRMMKRQVLDVHCTWKRPGGKNLTKVFKKRVAPSCDAAVEDLSRDLGRPLSADCECTGTSPTEKTP